MTRNEGARHTLIVPCHPVEFVGNKDEGDPIGPVKSAQYLEEGAPQLRVAASIQREGWSEIRSVGVAGRRAERNEVRISDCVGIVVVLALSDGGNWPPELLAILRVPACEAGVGHRHIQQSQKA